MAKVKASVEEFRLPGPTELNEPPDDLLSYCMFIYGEKGIGKTSLAAQFPDAVVGMLEPGRRNLRIRQVNLNKGWEHVKKFTKACCKDRTVKTVVYDTVDRLYDCCFNSVCYNAGVTHPNDANDFGKTWKAIKDEFENLLADVQFAGKGIVLLSHSKWKEIEIRDGEKKELLCPTLSESPWNTVKAITDYAFYYGYHKNKRAMYLRGHADLWCACGSKEHFLSSKTKKPLRTIYLGEDPELAFSSLEKAFHNQVADISELELAAPKAKAKAKA